MNAFRPFGIVAAVAAVAVLGVVSIAAALVWWLA